RELDARAGAAADERVVEVRAIGRARVEAELLHAVRAGDVGQEAAERDPDLQAAEEVLVLGGQLHAGRRLRRRAQAVVEGTVEADVAGEAGGRERGRERLDPDGHFRAGRQRVGRERAVRLVPGEVAEQRLAAHAELQRDQSATAGLGFGLSGRARLDRFRGQL